MMVEYWVVTTTKEGLLGMNWQGDKASGSEDTEFTFGIDESTGGVATIIINVDGQ